MNPFTLVFAIVLTVAVSLILRLWIRSYYGARMKGAQEQILEDERNMQELSIKAEKLEQRILALESILDKDIPDWRKKG